MKRLSDIQLRRRTILSTAALIIVALSALLAGLRAEPAQSAASPVSCTLSVQIFAAPFAVVDSNMPGVQGPKVAMIGARITNTGSQTMSNVSAFIGDGVTPGVFPSVSGGSLALVDLRDASHYLNDLEPGESVTSYWPLTYPATFDISYPYHIWASTPDGCMASANNVLTTQSEISATANKLLPTGSTMLIYPQNVAPGSTVTVQITGFNLGTIGSGPRPLEPRDAWLQPIGNLDFDPTCLRLVRSEVLLGSVSNVPYVDQLYFSGLTTYSGASSDYVRYTFIALRDCTTTIQPYQEAASGTQEKYNGDYEASTSRITIATQLASDLSFDLSLSSSTVMPGDTLEITTSFSSNGDPVGYPDGGSPLVIETEIPDQTTYVAGSTTSSVTADVQYSMDDGATWIESEPDAELVTNVRWLLSEPVDSLGGTTSLDVTVDGDYDGTIIVASGSAGILGSDPIDSDSSTANGTLPTPTPSPTPSPTPDPGVGSGEDGGLESGPLPGDPSSFLGGTGSDASGAPQAAATPDPNHKARLDSVVDPLIELTDLLPPTGPAGTTPTDVVPVDVLATTNAPDARAVDFVDANGIVRAVALGIYTTDGPYEHDYGVCNRFKEYELENIAPVALNGLDPADPSATTYFWNARATRDDGTVEEAFIFHVFIDETNRRFTVDSRWIQDDYPDTFPFPYDYVFSMQVWSDNVADSQALLAGIMNQMATIEGGAWEIDFLNTSDPIAPTIFIRSVSYAADVIKLTILNSNNSFQSINLSGTWRSYDDRNTLIPFTYTISVPPGLSTISLPFAGLLDVTLYLDHNGFTDKVYSGGGLWFTFDNTAAQAPAIILGTCRALDNINLEDLLLAGCAEIVDAPVVQAEQVGLGRTLNPNGRAIDVSPYEALSFWAKGDGTPVQVVLETASVSDGDFHQTVIAPSTQWQQYIIPLSRFVQRGFGTPVPFTGTDVVSVVWLNATLAENGFSVAVDQVTFTNSAFVTLLNAPSDSADTGPRNVSVQVPTGVDVAGATLHVSVDDGTSFTPSVMVRSGNLYSGVIPGQPLGSDVHYYIEAADSGGYTSRIPVDAPSSTYRYRVDDRSGLLVDDFAAGNQVNRLGGGAGYFNDATAGGQIAVYRSNRTLTLDYDVTQSSQSAGYFTLLGNLDASAYTTLNMLVRGAAGGEQLLVSIKDGNGYEPRLSAGDVLPGGVTTSWQWVQIPLANFPGSLDTDNLVSIALSFSNGYGPSSGRVEVRELRFTALRAPLTVDTFDDGNDLLNGRGLPHWTTAPNATLTANTVAGDAQWITGNALRLNYNVPLGGYALWSSELGGASVAGNAEIRLWLRTTAQGLSPRLYLDDGSTRAAVAISSYATLNSTWQQVVIPVSAFTNLGVDRTNLQALQIAFEFGSGSGNLFVDNILIGRNLAPQAERRTLTLGNGVTYPVALHLAGGTPWSATSDVSWLSVASNGAGPATLQIKAQPFGMDTGSYSGQVSITTPQGSETIGVTLVLTAPSGGTVVFLPIIVHP